MSGPVWIYRSPAVCYERNSRSLLIFAERKRSAGPPLAELALKRLILFSCEKSEVQFMETRPLKEAHLDGHLSLNPCPVFDDSLKRLFLFFTCVEGSSTEERQRDVSNKTRLCYISSEDLGVTWSKVTDLTSCLPEHCVAFSLGSGHGLQTAIGRLIVPAYIYVAKADADGEPAPHAVPLFSDDGGENWRFGQPLPEISTKCQMAEVCVDDRSLIYCNGCDQQGLRLEAFSDDNGDTFTLPGGGKLADIPPGCQGSVVSFPAAAKKSAPLTQNRWLLFSHPVGAPDKMDLAVFVNKTPSNPKAWTKHRIVQKGVSGPSDLAYLDNGWFACVYENNINNQISITCFN